MQYSFQFVETPFNDASFAMHNDVRDAIETLTNELRDLIDNQLRDEIHDANECDITLRIRVRYHDTHDDVDTIRVVHEIEYVELNDDVNDETQTIVATIERVQS